MIKTPFLAEKIEVCKQMYGLGSTINDLIEVLHDQGLSVDDTSVVIGGVLNVDPAEAHLTVADNPVWIEVVDQSSPVINEVMQVLGKDGELDDIGDGIIVFREPLAYQAIPRAT